MRDPTTVKTNSQEESISSEIEPESMSGKGKKSSTAAMGELKQSIAAMGIQEARRLVETQKAAMAAMAAEQRAAQKAVIAAKVEIARSKQQHEGKDAYGDEAFWEKRYADERSGGGGGAAPGASLDTYEWYLTFDQMRPLLDRDLGTALRRLTASGVAQIVVSGCGNSSLCEDLCGAGYCKVSGNDYSASVIESMQERTKALQPPMDIAYYVADVRDMRSIGIKACSHAAVVDKGTSLHFTNSHDTSCTLHAARCTLHAAHTAHTLHTHCTHIHTRTHTHALTNLQSPLENNH
jgi:hypothetical protein